MKKTPPNKCGPGRPKDPELVRRRRAEILRQATLLFARNGFAKTEINAIAEAAGCAKGTIYNYFSSKRDLFRQAVDMVMDGVLGTGPGELPDNPIESIHVGIQAFISYFDEHPEYIELLIQERAVLETTTTPLYMEYRKRHNERRAPLFARLIQDGWFRPLPIKQTMRIIDDLLYGTIFTNHLAGRDTSIQQTGPQT